MELIREVQNQKINTFELLAPAGSFEIFKAVIAAGADAVYVGGDLFGARAYANNFSTEELLTAIDYAHLHGRKVYLTVNTLLKNAEIGKLYEYLLPFYERGLDAVLVQDFGVFQFIRENFPHLPIHTSTQMTVTGVEGARLLQSLGAERIVMAREVSLEEMKQIHEQTGVEIEAFVHGALCYCYSGQCLLSSMLGGRSGNRGRCAQPCRLAYSVLDEKSYVLSLKDMCGIEDLNRLREAGVYSLKIEGRMKQIPYAAGVVSYYRRNIDRLLAMEHGEEYSVSESDLRDVADLGNRCGFTDGYYYKHNGADMVTFVKPSYEKTNEKLQKRIVEQYAGGVGKIETAGVLTLRCGENAVYEVCVGETTVCVRGMEVMEAQKKPLNEQDVRERMEKTGDTPFSMESIVLKMDENVFLPNGALNQLRREALEALENALLEPYRRTAVSDWQTDGRLMDGRQMEAAPEAKAGKPCLVCLTEKRSLLPVLWENPSVTAVYLDFSAYDPVHFAQELEADIAGTKKAGKRVFLALPRIFRQRSAELFEGMVQSLRDFRPDGFLIRTYEELSYVRENFPDYEMVIDHNLYTYNDLASAAFAGLGVSRNTVPLELNRGEIRRRDNRVSEMIVYGYYPLMVSAQCVHGNTAGCDSRPGISYLTDRYNVKFPVKNVCSACYNVIYNSLPVMLFTQMKELQKAGIGTFRLDFTVEDSAQAEEILQLYEEFADGRRDGYPDQWQEHYTNGHYKRGVE